MNTDVQMPGRTTKENVHGVVKNLCPNTKTRHIAANNVLILNSATNAEFTNNQTSSRPGARPGLVLLLN